MKNPISLGPMSLGQLFDRAFRLYRNNFWTLIGIVGLAQIISFIAQSLVSSGQLFATELIGGIDTGSMLALGSIILGVILSIAAGLISLLAAGAIAKATARALFGESFTIRSAFSDVLPRFGALFLLSLLIFVIAIGILIWSAIPIVGWFTGFGILLFFTIVGSLAIPAMILEGIGPRTALRRMWDLAKRRFWPVIGYIFLFTILTYILVGSVTGVMTFTSGIMMATNPSIPVMIAFTLIQVAFNTIATTLIAPLTLVGYTLLYIDLRVRFEGFDLTVASNESQPSDTVMAMVPNNELAPLFQRSDITKLALLNAPFFIFFCGIISLIASLTLLGPEIGEVFESITDSLN